jgi:SDR family mycofactocin-dependent oxidoreductase
VSAVDGRLRGKVALITGAARGQGRSHAVRLSAEGAEIIAVDRCADIDSVGYPLGTEADLAETVKLVEANDRRIVAVQADVRDLAALTTAVDAGVTELGRLDIVVANAGIAGYAPVLELAADAWTDMIDVNLTGVFWTVKAGLPHLISGGRGGSIVLTSSVAGLRAMENSAHYVAAKHGLVGLMKALALELGRHRIRVNTVHPTTVNTEMVQNDMTRELFLPGQRDQSPERFARVARSLNVLPEPWAEPEDISAAVAFLCSDEARLVTGAAFPVDAGMSIRW